MLKLFIAAAGGPLGTFFLSATIAFIFGGLQAFPSVLATGTFLVLALVTGGFWLYQLSRYDADHYRGSR